jgi:hypothetical protein
MAADERRGRRPRRDAGRVFMKGLKRDIILRAKALVPK